ncbi:MAG: hypothetical protein CM15mP75_0410 [Flammeovirgaceae bacterium]|nr:MAG: hypothetical protein CM15mP75_0410 [Flammeovirgaceae bacterium]
MNQFINRDEAMIILKNVIKQKFNHSFTQCCNGYGGICKKIDENIDEFYITGLLHDADYEEYPEKHPDVIVKS